MIFTMQDALKLEREAKEAKAELARAVRVVEAARKYKDSCNYEDGELLEAVEEWEAGR